MTGNNQSADDFLNGGGGRSAFPTDSKIGDIVEGEITAYEVENQTDMQTGEVKTFSDGKPMQQLVVTLQTSESVSGDDDGLRRFYAKPLGKNYQVAEGDGFDGKEALRQALAKAGAKLAIGGHLRVKQSGLTVPKVRGGKPSKLFRAQYTAPQPVAVDAFMAAGEDTF